MTIDFVSYNIIIHNLFIVQFIIDAIFNTSIVSLLVYAFVIINGTPW